MEDITYFTDPHPYPYSAMDIEMDIWTMESHSCKRQICDIYVPVMSYCPTARGYL